MGRIEAAVLACRILAVWALLQSVLYASLFMEWLASLFREDVSHFGGMQLVFPLIALASVLLWTCAGFIGSKMADFEARPLPDPRRVVPPQLLAIGLALVGVLDLLTSVPVLVDRILHAALTEAGDFPMTTGWGGGYVGVAANGLRVALGVFLVLGARGLANAVRVLRLVGLEPHEQPGAGRERREEER